MTFQVLDYKKDCIGYFENDNIFSTRNMPTSGATWEYSEHLSGINYDIAKIFAKGATLTDVCPDSMRPTWKKVKKALRAYLEAFRIADLSLEDNCLYDVIPEYFLFEFFQAKNKITDYVIQNFERPKNYDSMINLIQMLSDIKKRTLNIDIEPIMHLLSSVKGKNFLRTIQNCKWRADYNPWGTITGRLSTNPNSFPILTMGKEFRACLKPQNDWFIELDFNAAELRTLLALQGEKQPDKDIHDWNVEHIFNNKLTREEVKTKTFAWLYSKRTNKQLEQIYNKNKVQDKYWDGKNIYTDFNRKIENVEERLAINYILQSTTIDMVHEQALKVFKFLEDKESFISLLIHDAVYLDLKNEERQDLIKILNLFRTTRYGSMVVNVKAGKNLGQMKKLNL